MTAYTDFENSVAAAKSLTKMYVELRRARGLGRRGRLPPDHEDLLWLPRSAVVAAISALDAYVHAVIYEQLPHALRANPVPGELCEAMAEIIPIKNAGGFRESLPLLLAASVEHELTRKLREKSLSTASYQAPEKIQGVYAMIGYQTIFERVAGLWRGPNSSAGDLKRVLENYVKRRNQIAHEGDREASGAIRPMRPDYTDECRGYVESLVLRLNRLVYAA